MMDGIDGEAAAPQMAATASGFGGGFSPQQSIRHNRCFIHPHGIPGSEDKGWGTDRPWMSGCRYNDMVKETIYMAATQGTNRLRQQVEVDRHKQEAERAAFSTTRFSRQRDTAEFWGEMQDTFNSLKGHRPATSSSSAPQEAASQLGSQPGGGAQQEAGASWERLATPSSLASGARRELTSTGPATACYMPKKSASMPGLRKVPCIRGGRLLLEGGRGHGHTSAGLAKPEDFVPFKQEAGSRGLPHDFCPARPSHMKVAMWPNNRSYTIQGMKERGWD
mmetsp:Transcript_103971/g.264034  ORF Transcript_103971/g.264034 Transcript_103971/m.264034 type:complete len:278 (+) Transcript_103971:103-936(+)